jgi:hypothetical protein
VDVMTWQTIEIAAAELEARCLHIRQAGGTITRCDRCAAGYRLTWVSPDSARVC